MNLMIQRKATGVSGKALLRGPERAARIENLNAQIKNLDLLVLFLTVKDLL
jgi:hypothetical protein